MLMASKLLAGRSGLLLDAYGALFDLASAAHRCGDALGRQAARLADCRR